MKVSISAGLESAPQKAPSVLLIERLSSVIVWKFHRQVLYLAGVFRCIVFQGAITLESFHSRTSMWNRGERKSLENNIIWNGFGERKCTWFCIMNYGRPN